MSGLILTKEIVFHYYLLKKTSVRVLLIHIDHFPRDPLSLMVPWYLKKFSTCNELLDDETWELKIILRCLITHFCQDHPGYCSRCRKVPSVLHFHWIFNEYLWSQELTFFIRLHMVVNIRKAFRVRLNSHFPIKYVKLCFSLEDSNRVWKIYFLYNIGRFFF